MSFAHDIPMPPAPVIENCIAGRCGKPLTKYEMRRKMIMCYGCTSVAMTENIGKLLSKGTRLQLIKNYQQTARRYS